MYVGGTNFGFMNGANFHQQYHVYQPTVTSYDYDAPVSESGDLTPIWYEIRKILSKYTTVPELPSNLETPTPIRKATATATTTTTQTQTERGKGATIALTAHPPKQNYGNATAKVSRGLLDQPTLAALAHKEVREWTCTMEELGQSYGYILYESWLPLYPDTTEFSISALHDYGYVYLGDLFLGVYNRDSSVVQIPPDIKPDQTLRLRILVENMGRINYGPQMAGERKGITQGVYANGRYLANWTMYTLQLDNGGEVEKLVFSSGGSGSAAMGVVEDGPVLYSAILHILDKEAKEKDEKANEEEEVKNINRNGEVKEDKDNDNDKKEISVKEKRKNKKEKKEVNNNNDHDDEYVLADTYLDTSGLGKGVVFINGINLGRFWPSAGPQNFLYIPGSFLKKGANRISILDLQPKGYRVTLRFLDRPSLYSAINSNSDDSDDK